ncbi:MAG: hypothetical protein V5A46_01135 [Haloferacaceae archaeon]
MSSSVRPAPAETNGTPPEEGSPDADADSDGGDAGSDGKAVSRSTSAETDGTTADMLEFDRCENGEDLDLDDVFDLLKNQRRRWVIEYLKSEGGASTLNRVAETIAAKENGIDESMLSSSQRKRVYIGLYQCHLPKMDELGVVEYDKNRGTIELQDVSQLEFYLERGSDDEGRSRYEHVVGGSVGALVLTGLASVGPFAAISGTLWGILGAVTLIGLIAYQQILDSGSHVDLSPRSD